MNTTDLQRTTGKHIGFGKIILFGEHFVVYGATAIVAGIMEYTECTLELTKGTPGWVVEDSRPAVPGYINMKASEQRKAHQLVFDHLKIDLTRDGLRVKLGGPLVPSSGIGASASDVVSLSRALSQLYHLNLSEEEVNAAAFIGERGYHGAPSGVDNTAACYGGLLEYSRRDGRSHFTRMPAPITMYLVVISTGITASTVDVVADVKRLKDSDPCSFAAIMDDYKYIISCGSAAIKAGDLNAVGKLMDRNHALLQRLTVSCMELEAIVDACRNLGALGAKMSGTGRGGIAVALCDSQRQQRSIAEGLRNGCPAAKFIWEYSVDGNISKM
eukprot:Tbor_TRINITY_DN1881_c0_g1::TRINITY_DN1881_c0_g1_i1::g.23040::m.23040/K00869/E2.7.1.36, MVK, mvaK1; mevalonate kinase